MKVIAIQDFLFSLDGSKVTSFSKGSEVPCTKSQKENLIKVGKVVNAEDFDPKKDYTLIGAPVVTDPNDNKPLVEGDEGFVAPVVEGDDSFKGYSIEGIDSKVIELLVEAGYKLLDDVKSVPIQKLTEVKGIGPKTAQVIFDVVNK